MSKLARLLFLALTFAFVVAGLNTVQAQALRGNNNTVRAAAINTAAQTETTIPTNITPPATGVYADDHPFVVIIAVDTSKSVGIYAPLVRAELARVVQAIPNGIPFSIIAFDRGVRPVYRGVGRGDAVAQAEAALRTLSFTGGGSDIGAGLLAAASEASSLDAHAPALIVAITDGQPRPIRSSPFAGKGLDVLLGLPAIAGDSTQRHLAVRIYGPVRPSASLPNVAVMASEPNWAEVLARFADSARPSPSPAASPESSLRKPTSRSPLILLTLALAVLLSVIGWRAFALRKRVRAEHEQAAMLQQIVAEEPEEEPVPTRQFSVAQRDDDARVTLDVDNPSITIGPKFDDDLMVDAADSGARITFEARDHDDVELTIENTAASPILVGALEVPKGKRQRLPVAPYIEVSVGGEVFTIEEVVPEKEEVF